MYYVSTRNKTLQYSAAQAISQGLSREGGLFTPAVLPRLPASVLGDMTEMSYQQRAVYVLNCFLENFGITEITKFAAAAYGNGKFDHPDVAPIRKVDDKTYTLELWHGPTCAFKDMALQMLPHLLTASMEKTEEKKDVCILVATSGDTGKGALEGFRDVERTKILVFYPKDGVSEIQELQMRTQEGSNVGVCAVEGNFDDAQTGVKRLFSDEALREELAEKGWFLSSANSINWGRVLPQVVYYVSAYCDLIKSGAIQNGDTVNVCVPTGNFGNILAAYYAKHMGVPFGRLICASNANNVLTDFLNTGIYDRNRPFHQTISPSMDILISSNLERLLFALSYGDDQLVKGYMDELSATGRYEVSEELKRGIAREFSAGFCDDETTKATIGKVWKERKYLLDTHTAVAWNVLEQYRKETGDNTIALVASTASPFKFADNVLSALGVSDLKSGMALLDQLSEKTGEKIPAPLDALRSKSPRFDLCVAKDHMVDAVRQTLE